MESDTPIFDFLAGHEHVTIAAVAVSVFISLCLIVRVWALSRRDSVFTKVAWSIVLLIPILGWIAYSGFYHPPDASGVPASTEHSAHISGTGGYGNF